MRENIDELRPGHPSPIVPVVCGEEARALDAAAALLEIGILVPAIRPPTVPAGTSRLRVALSAAHTRDQVRVSCARPSRTRTRVTTVFMTGTATEVGKTWWGRATIDILRGRGATVAARQAREVILARRARPHGRGGARAPASDEPAAVVCPLHRWYPVPMAPPMAADALGLAPFTIGELVQEIAPTSAAITFVEGAGGPRSPMAGNGDNVALAAAVRRADVVVLVAPAGLGTINAVRLSVDAWRAEPPPRRPGAGAGVVVALNRYDADDDLHRRNHGWLAGDDLQLVTTPAELAGVLLPERVLLP